MAGGPGRQLLGRQLYREDTATLTTRWDLETGTLELADVMVGHAGDLTV
jgi:hypothetical protein